MDIKENKLVIFKNKKKSDEKHPDYRGEINVNGHLYDVSLWVAMAKSGEKYFNGSIQEPYKKPEPMPEPEQIQDDRLTDTDSLPF